MITTDRRQSAQRRAMMITAVALLVAPAARAQMRPPVLTSVHPYGVQRGHAATFVVEGANLNDADQVLFSDEGLAATIDKYEALGPDVREKMPGETGAVFQDRAALHAYTIHPEHMKVVAFGKAISEQVASVDFES